MVWIIARRQILDALLGLRFQVVLALTALLMGTCGLLFPLKYQELVAEYGQMHKRNLEGLTSAAGQLKYLASHYQTIPMRPARLGFLASGGEDRLPNSVELSILGMRRPASTGERNEFLADLADIDWAWVVQVLLSFAAIVLTYDAFCGERQDGTLRLIASHQVPRSSILLGKYVAALAVALIPLLVGILVGLLMLNFSARIDLKMGDIGPICLFAVVSAAFLSVMILLSLLVSACTRDPGTSLVVLLVAWTVQVVVVPVAGGALLNSAIFELPSAAEVERQTREAAAQVQSRLGLKRHYVDEGDDPETRKTVEAQRQMTLAAKKVRDTYRQDRIGVVRRVRDILSLAPSEAHLRVVEGIAGTGLGRVEHFLTQVEDYRGRFEALFQEEDGKDPNSYHLYYHVDYMSSRLLEVELIPQFSEGQVDWRERLGVVAGPLVVLVLYNGFLLMAAYLAFLRYDIC